MNTYTDSDGRECDLPTMCRREPGWAASRIAALTAEVARASATAASGGAPPRVSYLTVHQAAAYLGLSYSALRTRLARRARRTAKHEVAYRAADDAERAASVAVDKLSRFTCEVSDVHD